MASATEQKVHVRDRIYIGGEWVASSGKGVLEVINSTTEEVMGSIPDGTAQDVDLAVTAAREAFEGWSQTPVPERAEWIGRIAGALGDRGEEIAVLIAQEVGMPLKLAGMIQAGLPTMDFGSMPEIMAEMQWEQEIGNSLVIREPVGVVGEAMSSHPGIDMISFTGSTAAGRAVSAAAAGTVKRVALELGGKSPNVILDDADLQAAITDGVAKCFLNSGQTCSALTRMLVPRSRLGEAEQIAAAVAGHFKAGDPFDAESTLGPLVSEIQRERVRGYIRTGIQEGAKVIAGGPDTPEGLDRGFFVQPTVFSEVTSEMTIAQEEIFGPVLSIMPYEDEEDAVRIANDTLYGLAGGVWSADEERAKRVARRIRTGQVEINGGAFNPLAPFGGYKQSGHGRELGPFGLEEFLQVKSLQL
jgi:acyl-CoA reductase-like NAD-dependent aldehyde dehydrogenase